MMQPKFIHLCTQSDYSIISGLNKPKDLILKSVELNMPAIGMVDYGNFYGIIKFYKSAMKYGVKPIFGVKFKIQFSFIKNDLSTINILATNNIGYNNLINLISKAHSSQQKKIYNKDDIVINEKWLMQYKAGLIILSGGYNGDFGKYLINQDINVVNKFLNFYNTNFFHAYYFEIHRTNRIFEEDYIKYIIKLSILHNIPIVATNDVCFINKSDFYTHKVKLAIYKRTLVNSNDNDIQYSCEQFLKNEQEMCNLFLDIPSAIQNSVEIAKRCNVIIPHGNYFLPNFPTGVVDVHNYLVKKSIFGLKNRLKLLYPDKKNRMSIYKKYQDRLYLELEVIKKMNFPGYFLIVMEFIQWAKNNNIPVGPGRGSGAGSLVAYVLNITELDPLSFGLIFERFLNLERSSMPDFDIDFCMEKRDLVIHHVINFYGKNAVAQIITFGTMSARAVVRDVGRALGYPYGFVNKITQLIPLDIGITLQKSLSKQSNLINLYNKNLEVKNIIDISKKLEGVIRNTGKHAGGVVISPKNLTYFTPIQYDNNVFLTQFDKDDIDYVGLLKFDFLGLRTLTIIHSAIEMINKSRKKNNKKSINLNSIPLDDIKSFKLLKTGNTIAVFQLESYGMRELIVRLQPDCFEDIIALIALFRPGPLQSGMVDNFINRKHGRENISYPDPVWQHSSLKPVLQSTYGIILYQEQVMQIAQILANYTLSKADILQRAMSKKQTQEMAEQRCYFQKNSYKNGISYELSNKIFDLLENFSGYGFNKSHSAAYALISYQTLWMKSNYTAEFMAAVMSADIDNTDKIKISILECFKMGIKIINPNINISEYAFVVNNTRNIIYGLGAIKGLGKSVICEIVQVRKKIKYFSNLFQFCINISNKFINKRILEKLIFSGTFDVFNKSRCELTSLIPKVIQFSKQYEKFKHTHQLTLLPSIEQEDNILHNDISNIRQLTYFSRKILNYEKDVLGFYLTQHPIEEYMYELKKYTQGFQINEIYNFKNKSIVKIFGMISYIRIKHTKSNNQIVFLELTDKLDQIEVIIFHNLIKLNNDILQKDNIVIITGHIVNNNSFKTIKLIAHSILEINQFRNQNVKKIFLIITDESYHKNILYDIKIILQKNLRGHIPIYICYNTKYIKSNFKLHIRWNITLSNDLIMSFQELLGINGFRLRY